MSLKLNKASADAEVLLLEIMELNEFYKREKQGTNHFNVLDDLVRTMYRTKM